MSKTTALIIIVVAIVLIFGGVAVWYLNVSQTGSNNGNATSTASGISRFFPFGGGGQAQPNNNEGEGGRGEEGDTNTDNTSGQVPLVREISSTPVSGFSNAWGGIDGPLVRYIEQETGNVYEAPLNIDTKIRISNQTIPRVRETVWFPGGSGFIARYLTENDEIESFSATIKKATSTEEEGTLTGRFLNKNIFDLELVNRKSATSSKELIRVIYAIKDRGSNIYLANADGTNSRNIANIEMTEIELFPLSETSIFIQTKPSAMGMGSLFLLNTRTGSLSKIIGPISALSTLPNEDGSLVLFSANINRIPNLYIHNRDNGESYSLGIRGFADKCAWSLNNKEKVYCAIPNTLESGPRYPDDWYQGKISFTDSIFEIDANDTDSVKTRKIVDSREARFFIDTDIILPSDDDKFILLRDKTTKSLWSIKIQ